MESLSELVETTCNLKQEFLVTFEDYLIEFDTFDPKYKGFLLGREGSRAVTALHNQLHEGTHRAELVSEHPFLPYMTIATFVEVTDIEQVDISSVGELPVNGKLSALNLVPFVDEKLKTLKTAPFLRWVCNRP